MKKIVQITLVVDDYDEAVEFYTTKLKFVLVEDQVITPSKRWVVVAPENSGGCRLLLAKASNDHQRAAIGNQTGGRVFLFLHTDNFWRDYQSMLDAGVKFNESPREEDYGTVVVFEDLYGNKWDLVQPKKDR